MSGELSMRAICRVSALTETDMGADVPPRGTPGRRFSRPVVRQKRGPVKDGPRHFLVGSPEAGVLLAETIYRRGVTSFGSPRPPPGRRRRRNFRLRTRLMRSR